MSLATPTKSMVELIADNLKTRAQIENDWNQVKGTPKQWNVIRQLYAYMTPRILNGERMDPYIIDWLPVFIRIEYDIWGSIRYLGLPFYPQYPVAGYFVDFADPVRKIAIECDGKAFHDAKKDSKRDCELMELGWRVIRFTGRRCVMPEEHPESAHGELRDLADDYFCRKSWREEESDDEPE